ncbi:MAG: CidA/LrgA family protein [Blautia sp.]|nr:CidA/LrgA family protein [Blautia sp.]
MKQLLIILLISAAGEGLHKVVPLPIPASIYGLVILFLALTCLVKKKI